MVGIRTSVRPSPILPRSRARRRIPAALELERRSSAELRSQACRSRADRRLLLDKRPPRMHILRRLVSYTARRYANAYLLVRDPCSANRDPRNAVSDSRMADVRPDAEGSALVMSPHSDTYNDVTARILASLEQGTIPWRQPWRSLNPVNVRSGRAYRGINVLLLALELRGDPRWGTFKAWRETGASVRRGEKGTRIVLWKRAQSKRDIDPDTGEAAFYAFLRSYVVFNGEQVDGAPALEQGEPFVPIDRAQCVIDGMPNAPVITESGDRAFYRPSTDSVNLPDRALFNRAEEWYATAFHELTHATGAECRLGGLDPATFGSDPYAREELVAELGAAMLSASCGLDVSLESSAAYIDGWRRKLSADSKLIVSAAAESQRRADYIQNVSFESDETKQEEDTRHAIAA